MIPKVPIYSRIPSFRIPEISYLRPHPEDSRLYIFTLDILVPRVLEITIHHCSNACVVVSLDDRTRVKLWPYAGVVGSDYINASFVDVSIVKHSVKTLDLLLVECVVYPDWLKVYHPCSLINWEIAHALWVIATVLPDWLKGSYDTRLGEKRLLNFGGKGARSNCWKSARLDWLRPCATSYRLKVKQVISK